MSEEELKVIEDRANVASSGPWTCKVDFFGGEDVDIKVTLCSPNVDVMFVADTLFAPESQAQWDRARNTQEFKDGVFFVHARQDVPALVAEIRRLQALVVEPLTLTDPDAELYYIGEDHD